MSTPQNDLFSTLRVTHQSYRVEPGSTFVAIKGSRDDGARHIPEALARGAREIVIAESAELDADIYDVCSKSGVLITRTAHPRQTLAMLSAQAYGNPAKFLRFIGITGTKGKTTTSFLTFHILREAGKRVALLSTAENWIQNTRYKTELTTQQPDYLHAFFHQCVQEKIEFVVLEVAAQALTMQRTYGLTFETVAWLNFSREHGEFYDTQEEYWNAKAHIFQQLMPNGTAVLSGEQDAIRNLPLSPSIRKIIFTDEGRPVATDRVTILNPGVECEYQGSLYRCRGLLGEHNSKNVCAAIALTQSVGISNEAISKALQTFTGVPGRLAWYPLRSGAAVCIDYAHNPASFEATLSTLKNYTDNLIAVFGAGGDRDRTRRPIMGAIAAQYADHVFITTDNPRSESAAAISAEIYTGIPDSKKAAATIELDREAAIHRAVQLATPGSIIALLGKGPDEYHIEQGVVTPFSERTIISVYQ